MATSCDEPQNMGFQPSGMEQCRQRLVAPQVQFASTDWQMIQRCERLAKNRGRQDLNLRGSPQQLSECVKIQDCHLNPSVTTTLAESRADAVATAQGYSVVQAAPVAICKPPGWINGWMYALHQARKEKSIHRKALYEATAGGMKHISPHSASHPDTKEAT